MVPILCFHPHAHNLSSSTQRARDELDLPPRKTATNMSAEEQGSSRDVEEGPLTQVLVVDQKLLTELQRGSWRAFRALNRMVQHEVLSPTAALESVQASTPPTATAPGVLHLCVAVSLGLLDAAEEICTQHGCSAQDALDGEHGGSPLLFAAATGRIDGVQWCLDNGDDVNRENKTGQTASLAAAFGGNLHVLQFLDTHGATFDHRDVYGQTVLAMAARGHSIPVLEWLHNVKGMPLDEVDLDDNDCFLHACWESLSITKEGKTREITGDISMPDKIAAMNWLLEV